MVTEEGRQLAQFHSFTIRFSLPLRCEPEGASLRAGGLDPTGTGESECAGVVRTAFSIGKNTLVGLGQLK